MTPPAPATGDSKNKRRILKIAATVALLGIASGIATISSLALFTDSETVTGNTFSTGTVDLTTSPTSAVVTMPAMAPGDQVTATLDVTNSGSLALRYAMTSTTTEDVLAAELDLTIKIGVTTCDNANWTADGTVLYTGILGSTGGTAAIGSSATGADAGDRVLNAAASETLCVNVTLPTSASNASQGVTSTATFTFDAEQTANNP